MSYFANTERMQAAIKALVDMLPVIAEDGSNAYDFYCADVIGNKRFAQNHGGYPKSDIALINETNNAQLQASLIAQLTDYSSDSNPNAGLSDAEIMLGHRSKYIQTPSESVAWLEGQLKIRDDKRAAASIPKSEATIDFTNDDAQKSE